MDKKTENTVKNKDTRGDNNSSGVDNKKRNFRSRRNSGDKRGDRRPQAEFSQKIISMRRVTRVMAGGRRFSFSVSMIIGDKKGSVGVGMGKASDTALAIEKAYNDAKKNMLKVNLNPDMTVPHEVRATFASTSLLLKPSRGKGVIAGSSARTTVEMAGIKDVSIKIFSRSKNAFNNAKATIVALSLLDKPVKDNAESKEAVKV